MTKNQYGVLWDIPRKGERRWRRAAALATVLAISSAAGIPARAVASVPEVEELRGLSIEQLSNVDVTGVFKRPEALSKTPASVYVITREEIRRSGARTLPEALRLAPNLEVTRLNANAYSIQARGFNLFQLSNKMLVEVDGRTLYTPLHAGVFWDQQQIPIGDIDRIEVIDGPGGTVWGANAVNGVINIVTRDAHDTQGVYGKVDVGSLDDGATAQYGGKFGANGAYRVYGMGLNNGSFKTRTGGDLIDNLHARQGGFRSDWKGGGGTYNLSGDVFDNTESSGIVAASGGNLTGHWTRHLDKGSTLTLQAFYDQVNRSQQGVADDLNTLDIEGRHNLDLGRNEIVYGGGYRFYHSHYATTVTPGTFTFVLSPQNENVQLLSLFAEDSFKLRPDLTFTFGSKFEYSTFSGSEVMPSARVGWQFETDHLLWAAISRAVRTPSILDRDIVSTFPLLERAGSNYGSESVIAYELGYRGRPTDRSTLSVTFYDDVYSDLRVLTTDPNTGLLEFGNAQRGFIDGMETWGDYRVTARWRLMAGLTLLSKHLTLTDNAVTTSLIQHQGADPEYQVFLRSYLDITPDVEFDVTLRRIDALKATVVPAYTGLDIHLGWHVTDRIELALVGQNLVAADHVETGQGITDTQIGVIPRTVYGSVTVKF